MSHSESRIAVQATGADRDRSLSRKLPAVNVSVSWASNLLVMGGAFLLTPALLHALGDAGFGLWLLITSFISQMRILDLGMSSGCMKFSAGCLGRNDRLGLADIFNSSVLMFLAAGSLAALATGALGLVLPRIYPALAPHSMAIWLLGLSVVVELLCRPFAASLRARSLFFVYDGVEIFTYCSIKLGLVLYLALTSGLSLWLLACLNLGETVVRNALVLLLARRLCTWTRRPQPWKAKRLALTALISFSGALFIMSVADLLRFQMNSAIIGYFRPDDPAQIGIYGVGFRLVVLAASTIGVVWSVLIPQLSALYESGDQSRWWQLFARTMRVTGILTVFALVNITVFGLPFLKLWIHKPWVPESYTIMLIVMPAYFVMLIQAPAGGLLASANKLRLQVAITILEALLNVTFSLLLIGPFGLYGVALGLAIPMLLVRGILTPLVIRHELQIPLRRYFGLHGRTVGLAASYLPSALLLTGFEYPSFHRILLGSLASALLFAVLTVFWLPRQAQAAWRQVWTWLQGSAPA